MKRALYLLAVFLAGCSAVYVSENRSRGNATDNPQCVLACASNVNQPASAPTP